MGENTRKERPRRGAIGTRNKLTVSGLKDTEEFVYRWVNNTEDRIQECFELGYDIVDREGKTVGDGDFESASKVGTALTKGVGQGVTAYLMKCPKEVYDANRKIRVDNPTNELEAGMFREVTGKGTYGSVNINKK